MKYQCMCKAIEREDNEPQYSPKWITAKRAMFKVFEDHIDCGSWKINYSDIKEVTLYKTSQMFIPVNVLHIITKSGSYQFGFNPWAKPFTHLPMDYETKKVKLAMSPVSILIRIAALGYLGYYFLVR
jgi:hypothetical protein